MNQTFSTAVTRVAQPCPSCCGQDSASTSAVADGLWNEAHWFAVQTKPRRERLASTSLRQARIEVFLPTCRRAGGPVRPLFPGYALARFCPTRNLEIVRYARGVLRVVSSGLTPLPVAKEIVTELRGRTDEEGCLFLHRPSLPLQSRIEIQGGPLQGLIGRVERELDGGRRVMIFLESLLNSHVAVETDCVLPIAEDA